MKISTLCSEIEMIALANDLHHGDLALIDEDGCPTGSQQNKVTLGMVEGRDCLRAFLRYRRKLRAIRNDIGGRLWIQRNSPQLAGNCTIQVCHDVIGPLPEDVEVFPLQILWPQKDRAMELPFRPSSKF